MSILDRVRELVARGEVHISDHGYDELANDSIFVQDVLGGISEAVVIEEYPAYYKGPCVLVLQRDQDGEPIHVLWGIPKRATSPAVIITAYRPDQARWINDYTGRRE